MLFFTKCKSRRVVYSIVNGQVYACTLGFDDLFSIKHELQRILLKEVPLRMLTDLKQLFYVITKASSTKEKGLMIDIASMREAYHSFEINEFGLVKDSADTDNALSKIESQGFLDLLLFSGVDVAAAEEWIGRDSSAVFPECPDYEIYCIVLCAWLVT